MDKRIARIFEDTDGWHICDNALSYLDARGLAYVSRRAAIACLRGTTWYDWYNYTHYLTPSGRVVRL